MGAQKKALENIGYRLMTDRAKKVYHLSSYNYLIMEKDYWLFGVKHCF